MSQHDYNIANGGGAAVRADINNALLAVLSQNAGATEPTTTKPFMPWYDTTTGVLKMRNAADTAWVAAIDGVTGGNPQGMKNRIINGAMAIDQRNAGAAVTLTSSGVYTVDRWRGVEDTEERLCNRDTKLQLVVHAEANAIAASARTGRKLEGATLIVSSLFPCNTCAALIAQAGIRTVIAPKIAANRWTDSNLIAKTIFEEAGVFVMEVE